VNSLTRRTRVLYLVLAIPLLMAPKGKGCKCKPDVPETDGTVDTMVPPVEQKLQVVDVDPSTGSPGKPFSATVSGGGFQSGASVMVGARTTPTTYINENTLRIDIPGMPLGTYDVAVKNPDGKAATLRSAIEIRATEIARCGAVRVLFGFDSSALTPDGKSQIDAALPCWKSASSAIKVGGHTDERGTADYNIALGDRRAATVVRYLVSQGITGSRVSATSYGENSPVSTGHDEGAWALNRRAEIDLDD
jgi:peptidoglycan-associated lipoprotein